MKKNKITNALNYIDDELVSQAMSYKRKRSKLPIWITAGAVAALVSVCIGLYHKSENPFPVKTLPAQTNTEVIPLPIPPWDEQEMYQKYTVIDTDGIQYSIRKSTVEADNVAEKLQSVTAQGWEHDFDAAGDFILHTHDAEIYRINGISPECAVAVKFGGDDKYYSAVNSYYKPDILNDFVTGLNLRENLTCGFASRLYQKKLSGEYITVRYENVDIKKVWELLDSAPSAPNVSDEISIAQTKELLVVSVSIPLLGYENFSLSIREGGYVRTNLLDTGKMFYVGEENTEAFVDYVTKNCPGYEIRFEKDNAVPAIPE